MLPGRRGLQEGEHAVRDRARRRRPNSSTPPAALRAPTTRRWWIAKGNIQVESDKVRQVLEYAQKLVKFLPADAVSYDDASNNRALISGKSALIFNPPSAWAVAKRDAPQIAADCWTFPAPAGPAGRFVPHLPYFWGIWKFGQNKSAAKDLIAYLMRARRRSRQRCNAVIGYDLPPFASMLDFKVWEEVEPPKGTRVQLSDAAVPERQAAHRRLRRRRRKSRCRSTTAAPCRRCSRSCRAGQSIKDVIAWAQDELEGFLR